MGSINKIFIAIATFALLPVGDALCNTPFNEGVMQSVAMPKSQSFKEDEREELKNTSINDINITTDEDAVVENISGDAGDDNTAKDEKPSQEEESSYEAEESTSEEEFSPDEIPSRGKGPSPDEDPSVSEYIAPADTVQLSSTGVRKLGGTVFGLALEGRFGRVAIGGEPFLQGKNRKGTPIKHQSVGLLKFSFQKRDNDHDSRLYGSLYQGFGVMYSTFFHDSDIGNPSGVFLFQGARIAFINPTLSFNYEWHFGLTGGWKPYDYYNNRYNDVVGSKINAYLNVNFYLQWRLSKHLDLNAGMSMAHYSNGNTRDPNSGVNVLSSSVGFKYLFNRGARYFIPEARCDKSEHPRHMIWEIMAYASWKDISIDTTGTNILKPYLNNRYLVIGGAVSPMYHLSPKVNIGGSLNIGYDQTTNMKFRLEGKNIIYKSAPVKDCFTVGLGVKVDYVMPYFTLSGTIGYDVLNPKKYSPLYQILAIKIDIYKQTFLNIGYKAIGFRSPEYLMFGLGYKIMKVRYR